jgi:hypothetical protein
VRGNRVAPVSSNGFSSAATRGDLLPELFQVRDDNVMIDKVASFCRANAFLNCFEKLCL